MVLSFFFFFFFGMRWDAFGCFSFFSVFSEVTLLSNSFKFAFLLKLQSAYLVPTVTLCGGAVVRCLFSEACLALPFYPGAEGGSQKNLPEGGATPFSKRGRLQPPPLQQEGAAAATPLQLWSKCCHPTEQIGSTKGPSLIIFFGIPLSTPRYFYKKFLSGAMVPKCNIRGLSYLCHCISGRGNPSPLMLHVEPFL